METLGQYVPHIVHEVAAHHGAGTGQLLGLQLLILRILGSLSGHIAYSGYLDYFIGLAVLKPVSRWSILLIGYVTAAGLHAFWNASGLLSNFALVLVGGISYIFLAAAILKACQISPSRSYNFATQIIKPIPVSRPPVSVSASQFSLRVGGKVVRLDQGARLRIQEIPGLDSLSGDGVVAEVNCNPKNPHVLGLKNLSKRTWTVTLRDSSLQQVNSGQSIKLTIQTRINFGTIQGEIL